MEGYPEGFLVRLDTVESAHDMGPVFAVTGGNGAAESEWILPGGTRLALIREETETVDIDGQTVEVPVLYMEEITE